MRRNILYKISLFFTLTFVVVLFLNSCEERKIYTPKPKGYFRIDFPEHSYNRYDSMCPYLFEYPVYAEVKADYDKNTEPCWFNIQFTNYNATVHISYKEVDNNIQKYLEDSRTLAYKHSIKADAIEENIFIDSVNNVYGTLFDIKGNAASSVQFYLTDSTNHFVRGALYFNNVPNKDSLAPVIKFVRADLQHMIETFRWKTTDN